jgi:hypothetical protein
MLSNTSGGFIDQASRTTYLSAGQQTVSLDFDGYTIRTKGSNGTYHLSTLYLCNENGDTLIDESNVYTTRYYSYIEFENTTIAGNEEPLIFFVSPWNTESAVNRPPAALNFTVADLNGNSLSISVRWMNHQNTWVTLETFTGVYNGSYSYIPPNTNDWIWGNTTYVWSVNVTDGITWTNQTFLYITNGSRYDVNNNGLVNFQDAGLVWIHRTNLVPYDGLYDVNQDGQVNFQDAGLAWVNRNG